MCCYNGCVGLQVLGCSAYVTGKSGVACCTVPFATGQALVFAEMAEGGTFASGHPDLTTPGIDAPVVANAYDLEERYAYHLCIYLSSIEAFEVTLITL